MANVLRELVAGSEPVEFQSRYPLEESVERLQAATRRRAFSALSKQEAVGVVRASHVSLQRVIPMISNSFKPFFRGHFLEREGRAVLVGRFSIHPLVRLFMCAWFAFVVLIGGRFLFVPGPASWARLAPVGMLALGIALVAAGRWFARNDQAWLSRLIEGALGNAPAEPVDEERGNSKWGLLDWVALSLAGSALMVLIELHFLPGAGPASIPNPALNFLRDPVTRDYTRSWAAATLALAYGVYRRSDIAWRAGFFWIAVSTTGMPFYQAVAGLGARNQPGAVFFAVASLLVTVFWGRWWYAQQDRFSAPSPESGEPRS